MVRLDATTRRRWIGGLALFLAAAMLICGETFLKTRLTPVLFLLYWLVCLLLTGVAIVVALADLRVQRHRARDAERQLLETAIQEIRAEAKAKASRSQELPGDKG